MSSLGHIQLSTNFNSSEFDSPDIPFSGRSISPRIVSRLQRMRNSLGYPIRVSSGVRSILHNKGLGGVSDSEHLTGEGVDIVCVTSFYRYKLISLALFVGFNRIGVGDTYLHLGVSSSKPSPVIFTYYK